jgi:hypothetical protein
VLCVITTLNKQNNNVQKEYIDRALYDTISKTKLMSYHRDWDETKPNYNDILKECIEITNWIEERLQNIMNFTIIANITPCEDINRVIIQYL